MRAHVLIAILPDGATKSPPEGLVWHSVDGMTAVMTQAPAPLMRLPVDRKTRLVSAAEYQRSLETLMPYGTVVPVKQNTDLQHDNVPALLRANGPMLRDLGAALRGQDQYQISVAWDGAGVLQRFRDAPEIAGLFAASRINPQHLSDAVTSLSNRLRHTIAQELGAAATDVIALPCDTDTLANIVLLTPTHATAELDAALLAVDAIWTEGLRIRQIGPAAPASFATLQPHWISAAKIREAFTSLGLRSDADAAQISQARKASLREARLPKDQVDAAERIACAAINADTLEGFYLCDVWRDGTAQAKALCRDAA